MAGWVGRVPVAEGLAYADTWRPLRYLNLYRTILSGLFVVITLAGAAPRPVGHVDARLFFVTAVLYLAFSVLCSIMIRWRRPAFPAQVFLQVSGDILAITLLMYASGGVRSGFGMLLVVAVAGGSILTAGRTAILFAAIASLAVLAQELVGWLRGSWPDTAYTQSGMLGASFFATAVLAYVLARRVRASEAIARQRGDDLASLSILNEHIIHRMQSGIVAADAQGRVRLVNESARHLLAIGDGASSDTLSQFCPELARLVTAWRREPVVTSHFFRPRGAGTEVIASIAALRSSGGQGVLIFLEDSAKVTQRAQQLKLASLGRLTASIAHEIRNPLAAISHAGQLLGESPTLPEADRRLLRIIQEQAGRVNEIIENVMQLSRRREAEPLTLILNDWLPQFGAEYARDMGLDEGDIEERIEAPGLVVRMDPSQLAQVLRNLCDNGLRYAEQRPRLTLRADFQRETERVVLDVCDSGAGVAPGDAQHLFEPFFTRERTGTGLGLYIARELCEVNQASLGHLGTTPDGHCFRISFAHPGRQGASAP